MTALPEKLLDLIDRVKGPIVVLTGAGISAESGIPTFRGPEGYWQVGSKNYHPQELATQAAFRVMPDEIWAWYLYRRAACLAAEPNGAHHALVSLEEQLADRFLLITQNVDGLHPRAGQKRFYAIHGSIDKMRCSRECSADLIDVPREIGPWEKGRALGDRERALLTCARCGGRMRPHVLWFDESYDERRYKFESSIEAAQEADLVWIIGTSGATTLPAYIAEIAFNQGTNLVVLNADPSPFSDLAERSERGFFLQGSAVTYAPAIAERLANSGR